MCIQRDEQILNSLQHDIPTALLNTEKFQAKGNSLKSKRRFIMKRILVFTITTALVLLATAQLSIMALNNISSGERTFQMGRYLITQKWANDQDPPPGQPEVLSSSAYTQVFTAQEVLDDEGNAKQSELGWFAYSSTSYDGNNPNFQSSYHVKVKTLNFKREDKANVVGTMSASESLSLNMKPIPDNTAANIGDCEAKGKSNGQDPNNKARHATESSI